MKMRVKRKAHPLAERSEVFSLLSAEGCGDEVNLLVPLPLAHLDRGGVHVGEVV